MTTPLTPESRALLAQLGPNSARLDLDYPVHWVRAADLAAVEDAARLPFARALVDLVTRLEWRTCGCMVIKAGVIVHDRSCPLSTNAQATNDARELLARAGK